MKFRNKFPFLLTFSFLLLSFSLNHATIRYVSHFGSNTYPYTSWATSADSIMTAINVSVFGDTIYVANGVYEELVVMIPGLSLIGAGFDSCIVDGRSLAYSNYNTVIVKDSCLFKGFQVIVAYHVGYGIKAEGQAFVEETGLISMNKVLDGLIGIYIFDSDITVQNNICLNNRKGIAVDYSNSLISGNYITSNYEADRGILIGDLAHLYRPIIVDNYIETNSRGITSDFGPKSLAVLNNIIALTDPEGGWGITIGTSADTAKVINNLIMAKEYPSNLGGIGISNPPRYINNNLVFGKPESEGTGISVAGTNLNLVKILNNLIVGGEYGIYSYNNPSGTVPAYYNDIWETDIKSVGFTLDSTNLSADPMVVNDDSTQGELDFHLQMFSPLIDAGDPNILDKDSTRSDIGLYGGPYGESYIYLDLPPRPPVNLTAQVDSSIITLRWNKNTEADFNHYNLYRDTVMNFTIDSTKLVASITDSFYLHLIPTNIESLYFKLTAVDYQNNESNPSEEVSVILVSAKGEWQTVNNYILYQNYPNPFNPSTKIGYRLKERGYVKLYVYSITGELVSVLVNQTQEAGYYEVEFNASVGSRQSPVGNQLSSGVYIYQIMVRNENNIPVFSDIKKMIYLK